MIKQLVRSHDNILGFELTGRLTDADYQAFIPRVDAVLAKYPQVRILVMFNEFAGWNLPALWDDLRFTVSHYRAVERFAVVGQQGREAWVAHLGKIFTGATVRYFEDDLAGAWAWLEEGNVGAALAPDPVPVDPAEPVPMPLLPAS